MRVAEPIVVRSGNSLAPLDSYGVIVRRVGQLERGDGALTYVNATIAGNVN